MTNLTPEVLAEKVKSAEEMRAFAKENGIELDPEIVGGIADYIDENVEVKDEYTDEEINDVILSYYDVYLEYQKNGTLPDGLPEGFPIQ